jgi:hypothetical protein
MDNVDMIRIAAGICFAVVLLFLIQRRRKSVR